MAVAVTTAKPTKDKAPKTSPKAPASPAIESKPLLEGYSQEEAAGLIGCGQSTVSRAIRRGDIETLANGRIPLAEIEKVKALWASEQRVSEETAQLERRLLTAETGEREAKMELAKLRLERESGRFVELDAVQRSGADAAQRILAVLRAIPQRVAMELDAALAVPADRRAAAVEKIVSRELERAVAEMRDSLYLQAKSPPEANG